MARPTTRKDLLNAANEKYQKMVGLIYSMNAVDQEREFCFDIENKKGAHWKRDKNLRDVLIHLYEWHQLLISWIHSNINGSKKQFLLEPYNWKTYGDMNVYFWNKHQATSYIASKEMLEVSHKKVMTIVENLTNEELFEKGIFQWTGGSTLGQYCVSATVSHYDWAIKKMKKHIKNY